MRILQAVSSVDDRRVAKAWETLWADPDSSVKQLAESVGLSISRLQHLIVEHVGMTIREFKRRVRFERLHEAHRQLLETTDTILRIRELAGYRHDSNFIRDFKKLYGVTPAVCRRKGK